jgi:hypothetical protein
MPVHHCAGQVAAEAIQAGALAAGNATAAAAASAVDAAAAASLGDVVGAGTAVGTAINAVCVQHICREWMLECRMGDTCLIGMRLLQSALTLMDGKAHAPARIWGMVSVLQVSVSSTLQSAVLFRQHSPTVEFPHHAMLFATQITRLHVCKHVRTPFD